MRTFKFYKDPDNRWYVDLPEWTGSKAELEMVQGADSMLEYMAEGEAHVHVTLSEENFEGADVLEFVSLSTVAGGGAYYIMESYKGIQLDLTMWLCDVTLFVFGKFPNKIYITA